MSEAGQLCGERRVVLVEEHTEPRGVFCQKPSTSFCAGRAVISHIGKALTHNFSNNKADFFSLLTKALSGVKKMQEVNLILRLASAGVWIFIWLWPRQCACSGLSAVREGYNED